MTGNKNIRKLFLVILFVAAGTYIYWLLYNKPWCGIDDANIGFIYMRNFVEGHGFVYNTGGERVEGFTSTLWTLLGSIFFLLSAHPEILLLLFNILLVSVALWQIIIFADKLFGDNRLLTPFAFFLLGTVVLLPGYFDWTILSLMETGLWSCVLITSVMTLCRFEFKDENHKRNNYLLSALLILLVMCRPESYLWGIAFLAIRYMQLRRLRSKAAVGSSPNILVPFLCFIGAAVAITSWRLMYFGYPLPNTYYAKVSSDHVANFVEGIRYDYHFFENNFFLLLVFSLAVIYVINSLQRKSGDKRNDVAAIILISIIVSLAVPIYTGGDHFGQMRFIQPVIPLFYLIFFILVMEYLSRYQIKIRMYSAVAASLLVLTFSPAQSILDYGFLGGGIKQDFDIAQDGRILGNELSGFFAESAPLPSVAFLMLGGFPYVYKGYSMDLFGLNNVAVAHASKVKTGVKNHASFDKKIFYRLAPDIFFVATIVSDTSRSIVEQKRPDKNHIFYQRVYKGIFDEEEFRNNYPFVFIFNKKEKKYLLTYANKNFLKRLDMNYYSWQTVSETP